MKVAIGSRPQRSDHEGGAVQRAAARAQKVNWRIHSAERALGASEGTGVGISVGLIVACDGTNVGASDGVPDG